MSRPTGVHKSSFEELHNDIVLGAFLTSSLLEDVRQHQTKEFIQSLKLPEETLIELDELVYYKGNGDTRLIVPPECREEIIQTIHNLAHFGEKRTHKSVSKYYYWPGMRVQVDRMVKTCNACQLNKKKRVQPRVYKNSQ